MMTLEFLLYKMKKDIPENHSIMDLNYSIIENLLKNNNDNDFLIENNSNKNGLTNKNNSNKSNSIKNNSNLNDSNSQNYKSKDSNIENNNSNELIKISLNDENKKNTKTFNYNVEKYLKNKKVLNDENINNVLNRLKNSIEEKNEDFDEIIDKNIIKIHLTNTQLNEIKKTFSNILKEHEIEIDEDLLNVLYQKFKLETNIDNNDELMNVN